MWNRNKQATSAINEGDRVYGTEKLVSSCSRRSTVRARVEAKSSNGIPLSSLILRRNEERGRF